MYGGLRDNRNLPCCAEQACVCVLYTGTPHRQLQHTHLEREGTVVSHSQCGVNLQEVHVSRRVCGVVFMLEPPISASVLSFDKQRRLA